MQLNLKEIRKRAGFNQQELADKLGVKKRTYASWERREVSLSLKQAYEITEVLGCTLDELVGKSHIQPFTDQRQIELGIIFEQLREEDKKTALAILQGMATTYHQL